MAVVIFTRFCLDIPHIVCFCLCILSLWITRRRHLITVLWNVSHALVEGYPFMHDIFVLMANGAVEV